MVIGFRVNSQTICCRYRYFSYVQFITLFTMNNVKINIHKGVCEHFASVHLKINIHESIMILFQFVVEELQFLFIDWILAYLWNRSFFYANYGFVEPFASDSYNVQRNFVDKECFDVGKLIMTNLRRYRRFSLIIMIRLLLFCGCDSCWYYNLSCYIYFYHPKYVLQSFQIVIFNLVHPLNQ